MRKYNYIYSKMVENDSDIIGLIGYGLYKSRKIEYIKKIKKEKSIADISDEDLEQFHIMSELNIGDYKNQATLLAHEFAEEYLSDTIKKIDNKYAEQYQRKVENAKTSFLEGLIQSLAGSVAFVLLIGAIMLMIIGFRTGILGISKEFFNLLSPPPIESKIDKTRTNHNN